MYFGVDYHPEHWVYPYAGSVENPEARWQEDARLMAEAGVNVVRFGEYVWGICEQEEGVFDFQWMHRLMDIMKEHEIKVVLCTPTAAPPLWLTRKHPEILPVDENGLLLHDGTRHAACLNSGVFWEYSKRIVSKLAEAIGKHEQLIAWQIDSGVGGHATEFSFNEETGRDWHAWLEAKYGTIDQLNNAMGTRFWGQLVRRFEEVPMPKRAPTLHNPALVLDWMRFSSDTIVAYIRMQATLLREITPGKPVTTMMRALSRHYDHFDVAEVLDFTSLDSYATIKSKPAENAMEVDILRSLKKQECQTPDEDNQGFWVMEQKAGNVNWQSVNSLVRPGVVRLFTYQLISRGCDGILYFFWRQPRIGSEKFYGGILSHTGKGDTRTYLEIKQIGEEIRLLEPIIKGSEVKAETCILYSHDNDWSLKQGMQPTQEFKLREHIQLFHSALHDLNIPVDFARPTDDLSSYKLVIAPSLHQLAWGEADRLKLYVQNGGTLVGTCNSGLVDEHHIVPTDGFPLGMTDLFGLEVVEFDPLPVDQENHLHMKAGFPSTHMHPARLWCDIIEPAECKIMATFAKDFYAGRPALTRNTFGLGKAVYIGTMSHLPFYLDLITWLRQECQLSSLMRVPEGVEVSMRQRDNSKIYFLLNHQSSPVRIQFYQPVHDYLTGSTLQGGHDLPPHGVLVIDERQSSENG
ncbi:beta-galactosidase [bacterium]|nr:beta-galactosidase [bacterium]